MKLMMNEIRKYQKTFGWDCYVLWARHTLEPQWTRVTLPVSYEAVQKARDSFRQTNRRWKTKVLQWQILPKGIEPYEDE